MFPRIRKGSSLSGFDWKENPDGWGNEKKYPGAERRICVYVRGKNNSFEIHIIILTYVKNVNLPFKKDFKFAELLTKISFFLYFRDRSKNQKYAQELLNMHQKRWRKLKVSELSMSI